MLTVIGKATVPIEADIIKTVFKIESIFSTAKESLRVNNKLTQDSINKLLQLGINSNMISTSDFTLGPEIKYINYIDSKFIGFKTVNTVELQLDSIEIIQKAIDLLRNLDITSKVTFNKINYGISFDRANELKKKIIATAVQDAFRQARLAINSVNYKITGILSIALNDGNQSNSGTYYPYSYSYSDNIKTVQMNSVIKFKIVPKNTN
jgi:uncharacterized protein YggE